MSEIQAEGVDPAVRAPRVSVVVPAFNNAEFIEETLESILAQTYDDFELIVADHSSTDDTWKLIQRFATDPRVRLTVTEAGGGAKRNWNQVTSMARGELLKLVCGDDLLYPDSLERQVAALDAAGEGVVMVASSRDVINSRGRVVLRNLGLKGESTRLPGLVAIRRSVLAGANIFGEPCCVLFRTAALAAIGGWQGEHDYHIDQLTYARVLMHGDLVTAPGPLAAFRLNAGQWSVRLARVQASSAREVHGLLAAEAPGLLSARDIRVANARARLRSVQRRIAYLFLV